MNRKVLKNIATLTLLCFMLTPLYSVFGVKAAERADAAKINMVVENQDGEAVEGAALNITEADIEGGQPNKVTTDKDGRFGLIVPPGEYIVSLADDVANENTTGAPYRFHHTDGQELLTYTINTEYYGEDAPKYQIALKAVDASRNPLAGVTVKLTLKGTAISNTVTSNEDGVFDIELPEGKYVAELISVNGVPDAYASNMEFDHSQLGNEILLMIHTEKVYDLVFEVYFPDGSPALGEELSLTGDISETKTVSQDGSITFTVPAGTYGFSYVDEDGEYLEMENEFPLVVGEGYELKPFQVNLKSAQTRKLTVQVFDEDDNAIEGMQFKIYSEGLDVNKGTITTDSYGTADINLPPDTYIIKNTRVVSGYVQINNTTVSIGEEDEYVRLVALAAGQGVTTAEISMQVVDSDNNPCQGVTLEFYKDASTLTRALPSKPANYTAESDDSGMVYLTVEKGNYTVYITSAPANFDFDDEPYKKFSVDGGDRVNLGSVQEGVHADDNPQPPVGQTEGTVTVKVISDGTGLAGVGFSLQGEDGNKTNHVSETNPLQLVKEEGNYTLTVTSVPEGHNLTGNASTKIAVVAGKNIDITLDLVKTGGDNNGNDNGNQTDRGSLSIHAIFNGTNVSGIGFSLHDVDGNFVTQGTTDGNGILKFESLQVGSYTLYNTTVTGGYELMNSRRVTIQPNQTTEVNVAMALKDESKPDENPNNGLGKLVITLKDHEGMPIPNAVFTLYDHDDEVAEETTNSEGKATFLDLEPGTYFYVQTEVGDSVSRALTRESVSIAENEVESVSVKAPRERGMGISGIVFEDVNANGVYDSADDELRKGARVQLLDDDGELLLETKTDADGEYRFRYIPDGDYTLKLDEVRGYKFIDKKYGSNLTSSSINKRGEVDIYVEGEDEENIMMGIVSEDETIVPVGGNNSNNNNQSGQDNRFPTLDGNSDTGLFNSVGSSDNNGTYQVPEQNNDGLFDVGQPEVQPNQNNVPSGEGEDIMSNLPDTGDSASIGAAMLYLVFMFAVLFMFRRFVFDRIF